MIRYGIRSGIQSGLRSGLDPFSTAIAPAVVTESSDGTDRSSYTVASHVPVAGMPYLLAVGNTHGTAAEIPNSVVGNGITWLPVTNGSGVTAAGVRRVTFFYGSSLSPTEGTIAIGTAGTMTSCAWALIKLPGAARRDAIQGTTTTGNATTLTGTLAQLASTSNIHIFAQFHAAAEASVLPTTGNWTALVAGRTVTTPNGGFQVAWAIGRTSAAPTWTTSSSAVMVDLEIGSG